MAFQPDKEYKASIGSYSLTEDNDGRPEIHIGVIEGNNSIIYKMKFGKDTEKKKSLSFALRFGADRNRLHVPAYLEQWGNGLVGSECYIRTKAWEIDGKSGVYVNQISPKPFPPVVAAVASIFGGMDAANIAEDELPF